MRFDLVSASGTWVVRTEVEGATEQRVPEDSIFEITGTGLGARVNGSPRLPGRDTEADRDYVNAIRRGRDSGSSRIEGLHAPGVDPRWQPSVTST